MALMEQTRAGQASPPQRGEGDSRVIDVIERAVEGADGGVVASLEAELLRKQALVPGAAAETARLRALLARGMEALGAYEHACLSIDMRELKSLDKDIRVLKMRVGRERKRADASARQAQRALDGAKAMRRISALESDSDRIAADVQRAGGSSVAQLVAEAWDVSSLRFRAALLRAMRDERAEACDLMDRMVECWGEGQGRSYRHEDTGGGVAREAFDFTATAYLAFVEEPRQFGWEAGSSPHAAAVAAMRRPLQKAFASAIRVDPDPGSGSGSSGGSSSSGSSSSSSGSAADGVPFGTLLRECSAALKVRRHRAGRHPLRSSDPAARAEMLDLYRQAVAARLPIIDGFVHLARASVPHVEEELANQAATDARNDPSAM
jgi:hypothetical protein